MIKEELLNKTIKIMPIDGRIIISCISDCINAFQPWSRFNPGFTLSPNEITIDTIPEDDINFGEINLQVYKTPTVAQYDELATEIMKESNLIVESFLYSLDEKLTITSGRDEEPPPENIIPLTNNTTLICILKGIHKIQIVLYSFNIFTENETDVVRNPSPKKRLFLS